MKTKTQQDAKTERVELRFKDKPDKSILDAVKVAGFKWDNLNRVWFFQPGQVSDKKADDSKLYVIESGIPIPKPLSGRPRGPVKTAMSQLNKGNSFLVPGNITSEKLLRSAHDLRIKIATRKQEDGSRRIWRIK